MPAARVAQAATAMAETRTFRMTFSVIVVVLLVLPVPPTSIIAVAIMGHPRGRKLMDPSVERQIRVGKVVMKRVVRKAKKKV